MGSPSEHIWALHPAVCFGTHQRPWFPPSCRLPLTLAGSMLPGKGFIHPSQQPAFSQTAGHQRGFVCKCWFRKNHRKQTLDLGGSAGTLHSKPLTLQLGTLVWERKGALEGTLACLLGHVSVLRGLTYRRRGACSQPCTGQSTTLQADSTHREGGV